MVVRRQRVNTSLKIVLRCWVIPFGDRRMRSHVYRKNECFVPGAEKIHSVEMEGLATSGGHGKYVTCQLLLASAGSRTVSY